MKILKERKMWKCYFNCAFIPNILLWSSLTKYTRSVYGYNTTSSVLRLYELLYDIKSVYNLWTNQKHETCHPFLFTRSKSEDEESFKQVNNISSFAYTPEIDRMNWISIEWPITNKIVKEKMMIVLHEDQFHEKPHPWKAVSHTIYRRKPNTTIELINIDFISSDISPTLQRQQRSITNSKREWIIDTILALLSLTKKKTLYCTYLKNTDGSVLYI